MTATPRRDETADTYDYFGGSLFEYSLAQGIEDGFLAPYRVRRVVLSAVMIARAVGARTTRAEGTAYPRALTKFSAEELVAFGEKYLQQTRVQRKTAAPFFIDKMPNNFAHLGFIHLMLPRAKIIDARRHPLGCCL